ncbi:MAG TPA: glycosyl hydrolase [Verrucomicrobiae bacterium]|nr:glycosyl hydrolase [Verrucomicrobiae bacterium]
MTGAAASESIAQDNGELSDPLGWGPITREQRPWTRWWWLGNAVDRTNLTSMLTQFRDAGFGGVEICPIYGVRGYEDRFIPFLSARWMEMFAFTVQEAKRLGLGVDLTGGTGWPYGGRDVTEAFASSMIHLARFELGAGEALRQPLPKGRLQSLTAISGKGERLDLTLRVKNGKLDWAAPEGSWRLYALAAESPIQKVKRAAPGGEGNVLNPYSIPALNEYLAGFDKAFAEFRGVNPRAWFHDSFEYYAADWSPDFFAQFRKLRGYDLRTQMPALFGEGDPDTAARVRQDYRETISDLHVAWIERWTAWAHRRACLTRDQAHGAPANLVDAYAAADIPETEIFGRLGEANMLMNKLSSSAAHLGGHKLSSAESFTWLTEHFQASLAQVQSAADQLFLSGVNHMLCHGIPYSPAEAPWPGWQFYAAVNFGPSGGLWRDLPCLNAYVTRCQSILQSGAPASDVLLYFPAHDFWHQPGELLMPFTVEEANRWLGSHPVHQDASYLWEHGYGYDVASDRFLRQAQVKSRDIVVNGNVYRAILVPKTQFMPEYTLKALIALARDGESVLFENQLPEDVPGLGDLEERRAAFHKEVNGLGFKGGLVRCAKVGKGALWVSDDPGAMLEAAGVTREPAADLGLRFVRRRHAEGYHYFIANRGDRPVDGWIRLGTRAASAVLLDPRYLDRVGLASTRATNGASELYLQLNPGDSIILRTFTNKIVHAQRWPYYEHSGEPTIISGKWKVEFIEGGPVLPAGFETSELGSWTAREDPELRRFAGTARYTIQFDLTALTPQKEVESRESKVEGKQSTLIRPSAFAKAMADKPATLSHRMGEGRGEGQSLADDWLLDPGEVCDSARVKVNGIEAGTFWCKPFEMAIGKYLKPGSNTLEFEVSNLAANRVRDLDIRHVRWKYFYDINMVGRDYKPLDASKWPVRDSGLLGRVVLKPVRIVSK